ncbi:Mur ligase family protein, partial [uncultured Bilophila sp.]|uniref:Mur ligase family protein n=1 Tax=uncultured Bilophila sp. TaxID=529385 RepID=UPI00261B871E
SHAGDMDELGAILEPDVALILNVGPGHAAGLGDRGTAYYKARLLSYLAPGGMAVVSADYPELVREARAVHPELVFFSAAGRQVDYRASYVTPAGEDKGLFRLWLDGVSLDVEAPFRGAFGAENVIAVAAVAHRLGLTPDEIAAGFAGALLPKQRFACSQVGRWLVIDDSYNANPLSFARMLEAAAEMAGDRPDRPFVCVRWASLARWPQTSTALSDAGWLRPDPAPSSGRAATGTTLHRGLKPNATQACFPLWPPPRISCTALLPARRRRAA